MNLRTLARSVLTTGVVILTAANPAKADMKIIGHDDDGRPIWVSQSVVILRGYQDVRIGAMSIGRSQAYWVAVDCVKDTYSLRVKSHRHGTWSISENSRDWVYSVEGSVGSLAVNTFCSYEPQ